MKAWKENEGRVAEFFGTRRNPLSGSGSAVTASDTRHPHLFIEQRRRKRHAVIRWWDQVAELARREGKIPVVTLTEHGRPGFWILVRSEDLATVATCAAVLQTSAQEAAGGA